MLPRVAGFLEEGFQERVGFQELYSWEPLGSWNRYNS